MDILTPIKSAATFLSGPVEKILKGRSEFNKRVAPLSIIVRDVHDSLLYSSKLDVNKIEQQIGVLEASTDPIWIKDNHYYARMDFLRYSNYALNVLRKYGQFRNGIEESETRQFLTDAKDRLMAIFKRKRVPPAFNPFDGDF